MNKGFTGGTGKPDAFRHELKYIISEVEKAQLRSRLGGLLRVDENARPQGFYSIRSLYFDDFWNSAYHDKMMGVECRRKYRIRIYNGSDRSIRLEKKVKRGNYIFKESAELSRHDVNSILNGGYHFLLEDAQKLCNEFYYACTTCLMRPRVMVDYEREPFICESGDVRITFDTDVRAGVWKYDLFDDRYPTLNVLPPGLLIMEVKFTELLPDYIRSALPVRHGTSVAVSKYVLGCDVTDYAAR